MPLNKSKGNMYPWCSHTHAHLGGECPHRCSYCYVNDPRFGRPLKFQGPLRLLEEEFTVKYGENKTIFIDHMNDLWAKPVKTDWIKRVLEHCQAWPKNTYVFQTKNPERYRKLKEHLPPYVLLGCTIETNRMIPREISEAPCPFDRIFSMTDLDPETMPSFVTIEPIMDLDVQTMAEWIVKMHPRFVNIGADSKGHNLSEPSKEKVLEFIKMLQEAKIEIREKYNLGRILNLT